jgi:hypothetical protein
MAHAYWPNSGFGSDKRDYRRVTYRSFESHSLRHLPEDPVLSSPKSVAKCVELAGRGDRSLYLGVGLPWLDCSLRPIFLWSSVLLSKSTDFLGQYFQSVYKPPRPTSLNRSRLSKSEQALLNEVPMRGTGTPMPPTDPLIYRFYELVMVNGPAWKALIEEEFDDACVSRARTSG